jgi:hypothetical protein
LVCLKFMKTTLIIILTLLAVMIITQAFVSKSTRKTEQHAYKVLKVYEQFEVRKYEPALFSSVKLANKGYKASSGTGFRVLAGYIFGDNKKSEKIAMTTPVVMELGDSTKMSFMVPKEYTLEQLPQPSNTNIVFEKQEEKIIAAIRFDGWASDEKIEQYTALLTQALIKEDLEHNSKFSFLGYNPPYELVNRRNEVVVELLNFKSQ